MDKFYQPNSGLRGSRSLDEAVYTYIIYYIYVYCTFLAFLVSSIQEKSAKSPRQVLYLPKQRWTVDDILEGSQPTRKIGTLNLIVYHRLPY